MTDSGSTGGQGQDDGGRLHGAGGSGVPPTPPGPVGAGPTPQGPFGNDPGHGASFDDLPRANAPRTENLWATPGPGDVERLAGSRPSPPQRTGPGQVPQGAFSGYASGSGGPPPRRRGLPVWGWVLIGAGTLVVGLVGVVVVLAVLGLAATFTPTTASETGFAAPPSTDVPGGPVPEITGPDPAAGTIDAPEQQPLESSALFTAPPSWAQPVATWTMDDLPADGISTFSSPNGCDLLLEQAYMPPLDGDDDLLSDAPATSSYMVYLLEFFADLEGGTIEGQAGTVPLSINFAGGPTVDLSTTTLPGLTLEGDTGVRYIATRAMPASEGVVSAVMTCPQAVLDADPAFFSEAMARLYILPTP
ncbi:hypothetical protein [Arthrobacter sp. N1]|uniref:hypothetical protein n=1 Tax=Arthrobacter sp. N1 TaxID=619291 RepID=UPI003BAEE7F4